MIAAFNPIVLKTLAMGTLGGAVLAFAGLPGGWIAGSMLVVGSATLSGVHVALSSPLQKAAFLIIGISMGSGVTPQTIERLPSWPVTLVLVVTSIPLIVGAVYLFLTRVFKWDAATALLSAMPGALSYLLALAPSAGADVLRVALLQSTRVAILVALLPIAALWLVEPAVQVPNEAMTLSLDGALILFAAGTGGAILAHMLGVPAGLLIGGLFVSAFLHGAGLVEGRPPSILVVVGFITLGTMIGTRFTGRSWSELGQLIVVSLQSFAIGAGIAVLVAMFGSWLTGLDLLKLILAFAPGGLEVMVVLAFALDLDPAFVAAHHLVRFMLIALAAPFVLRAFGIVLVKNDVT